MKFHQTTTDIGGNLFNKKVSLSGNDASDVRKVTQFMVDTIKRQKRLWRKELNDWTYARQQRYAEKPKNYLLQEVYDDVMMDGHLTGITENRTYRTTNKEFIIVDPKGIKSDEHSALIQEKEWFELLIDEAHKSTYNGAVVVWLKEVAKSEILSAELVDRGRFIPDTNIIVNDYTKDTGINILDFPEYLIRCQMYGAVGLLEKAAPYTILKRHSWGSWDEFEELFGIPIRIAKIASQSETVKNEVSGWLEEMGRAPYAVFPLGTEVEIKENSKGDAFNVFFQKIQALDAELSKLVLHQTMTTENGASKAQGNVHENTLKELVFSDEKRILSILNNRLLPAMRMIGYKIPEGYKFAVAQTKDPSEQINIDKELLKNGVKLKKEYLEELYGVEVEEISETKPTDPPKKD